MRIYIYIYIILKSKVLELCESWWKVFLLAHLYIHNHITKQLGVFFIISSLSTPVFRAYADTIYLCLMDLDGTHCMHILDDWQR